ncbi:hypothetical protein ACO2I3_08505 [Leptospira interrogans]
MTTYANSATSRGHGSQIHRQATVLLTTASTVALSLAVIAAGLTSMSTIALSAECAVGGSANGGDDNDEATNTACGQDATADGLSEATAIGSGSSASAIASTAVGSDAEASGTESAAYGASAEASGGGSTALGSYATASGTLSTAVGRDAEATGVSGTAVGASARATGDYGSAFGPDARASGTYSSAIGERAIASGVRSTAVGSEASAGYDGSAAFGAGAQATRENQQVFGTADNTYTMAGIASDASRAAQGAPTHIVTSNANGDLAAYTPSELGLASAGDIAGLRQRDDELADGIAISMALSQPFFHNNQQFALNLGWGNFEGNNAFGITAAGIVDRGTLGPSSTTTLYGGVGVGLREGTVGARAGLTLGW